MNLPLIVHTLAGGEAGGAETACLDTVLAQHEAGWPVRVVLRPHAERQRLLTQAGIIHAVAPFGGVFDLWTPLYLRWLLHQWKPGIVQPWMRRAAEKTPRSGRYKTIARLGGYYKVAAFKGANAFIAAAPDIGRHLETHKVPRAKITVIPHFVDFPEGGGSVDRATLDTPKDAFVLLFLGRLHPSKAADVLLEALALVPGVYLWLAGTGDEEAALRALCQRLHLEDRVRFLGWRSDRGALLKAADAVVFPSRYEPVGRVLFEAWAAKKPLIVSMAAGPLQYVTEGETGLFVPIDDAPALAAAIKRVFENNTLSHHLAYQGHQRYVQHYTKAAVLEEYQRLYSALSRR
ncbi:MAG: glycosyltransferase [Holosporales bacterium]